MKASEYLDKCKIALAVQSDYALAKALEIPTQRIADFYLVILTCKALKNQGFFFRGSTRDPQADTRSADDG